MAKEKKKNLKPIHWLIIAEVIVVVVGLLLGFKITYAPHLENDWDAISAVAGWAGAVVSAVALIFAIRIPKIIAAQQDKIALFEKRNELYSKLATMFYDKPLMHTAYLNEHDRRHNVKPSFAGYNSYMKQEKENSLLTEASFLFSPAIGKKVDDLIKLRKRFYAIERLLEEGITYLSDADFEALFTECVDMLISQAADIEKIKSIADRSPFIKAGEPLGKDGKPVIYNLYELGTEQDGVEQQAKELQDEIMADIVEEMRIYSVS